MATKKPTKKSSNVEPPIPAPPYGSRSMRGPARLSTPTTPSYEPSKAERIAAKAEQKRMTKMQNDYLNQGSGRVSTGKVKAKYAKGVINPGRAQPPRTAPNSSGQGGRYSRLTGGLLKHGR